MIRGIAVALLLSATAASAQQKPAATAPAQSKGCDTPESHQFDFWVGNWKAVNKGDGSFAGTNTIEKLYKGCTIRENWAEPGLTGGSLTTYNMVDGHMVMIWSHPSVRMPGKTAQERMTFTLNPDGTIRQHAETSPDSVTWVESYDIIYHRIGKRRA